MVRLLRKYKQRIFNTAVFCISFFLFLFPFQLIQVKAQTAGVVARADWNVDESLYTEEKKYSEVTKVNLVVIETNSLSIRQDCRSWANSLYYYFTTRLGTKDIPFAYLACQDGTILEGAKQKEERDFGIINGDAAINIPILTTTEGIGLSGDAYTKLETFINTLATKYAINKIEIKKLQVDLNTTNKSVKLSLVPITTAMNSFQDLVNVTISNLKPAVRTVNLVIKSTTLSATTFKPGDLVDVKVTVQNNSGFNLYGSSDNTVYAITDNPFDSKTEFYAGSDFWSSLSRIQLLKDDEIIMDKETKDLIFKVKVPLRGGKLSQSFVLTNKLGVKISGTTFKVEVNSDMTGMDIIEIQSTENGKLNVRDVPNGTNIITKVFPKERYIVYQRQSGWLQIDVGGIKGWILATYAKSVSN